MGGMNNKAGSLWRVFSTASTTDKFNTVRSRRALFYGNIYRVKTLKCCVID